MYIIISSDSYFKSIATYFFEFDSTNRLISLIILLELIEIHTYIDRTIISAIKFKVLVNFEKIFMLNIFANTDNSLS